MDYNYRYLRNTTNTSDSTGLDDNEVEINYHDADTAFTTEAVGAGKTDRIINFNVVPSSITGTGGTLTIQFSDDGINWKTLLDDSGSDIEWTVDNTLAEDYATIINPKYPHYRLNYTVGSVTGGTLAIRLLRN